MTLLGLWLAALGIADLVGGGAGGSARGFDRRKQLASAAAGSITGLLAFSVGYGAETAGLIGGATASGAFVWLRITGRPSPRAANTARLRNHLALGLLAVTTAVLALVGGHADPPSVGNGIRWVQEASPYEFADQPTGVIVAAIGAALFLTATSNTVVRLVLSAAEAGLDNRGEAAMKGGRMIGPPERLLLLAFVVAGQPTAAALVVSAKSLLRYPEVSRSREREPDNASTVSEYALVGSLTSWAIALALAALVAAASS